jgi:hypothetical protein
MSRASFREQVCDRDDGECLVYCCNENVTPDPDGPGEQHHIVERKLWEDGGYIPENGANVCNYHHRLAEKNVIPPQSLWRWAGIEDPPLPNIVAGRHEANDIDKWGEFLGTPPWQEYRDYIKYPSTRHLPFSHERDDDDTAHQQLDWAMGYPLVATVKMDGGNAMLVHDTDEPIRARNGRQANKEHFDMAKQWYWENSLYSEIPEYYQIFGEWLYAKHSIHYGCDCDEPCEDVGPALRDYFQVFGIYDTRYNLWLGWEETMDIAAEIGLTMTPPAREFYDGPFEPSEKYYLGEFDNSKEFWQYAYDLSTSTVDAGHEGIVIRSAQPFNYGQMMERLGKYVRPGHVKEGEKHWSNRPLVQNNTKN